MVAIPQIGDPLVAMLRKTCESKQQSDKRDYLGASGIGHPCARKIWYDLHGEPERFDCQTLWRFEDGHRTEELIIQRLRLVPGLEIWTHDENGNQYGFSDFDGKFRGHVDGIIRGLPQAPKTAHVLEIKCTEKLAEFQKIKDQYGEKNALEKWNMQYFVQAQIYMHYFDMTRHYTIVSNPGGRDLDTCRTEYRKDIAFQYKDRAFAILQAKEPPPKISEKPDFYICRSFCGRSGECHGNN